MRDWRATATAESARLTRLLRTPGGTQELRPIQAAALSEADSCGGLFLGARVSGGKTHVAGLLPVLWGQRGYTRPLIITSGSMVKETETAFAKCRVNWQIARYYDLVSYSKLSRESAADYLDRYRPDIIICDEADALRRLRDASVPRRLARYREAQPHCRFAFMSGTFYKSSVLDFAHLLSWSLGPGSPMPLEQTELEQWSQAIDEGDGWALRALSGRYGCPEDLAGARRWFRERLRGTPGVVISDDYYAGSQAVIDVVHADPGPVLDDAFYRLRELWERPDGWSLAAGGEDADENDVNAAGVWAVARQLSLGFYYAPDPPPPREWMAARRAYFRFVRACIESQAYDTEKQVRSACIASAKPIDEWVRWRDVQGAYVPNRTTVWVSDHALRYAEQWGRECPGVVWCEHEGFADELERRTHWRHYGPKGLSSGKQHVTQATAHESIIVSRQANFRGRELQWHWARGLIMAPLGSARDTEQTLGRKMREGQSSPVVSWTMYVSCIESANALERSFVGAEEQVEKIGVPQILLNAHVRAHGPRPSGWAWGAAR